MIRRTRPVGPYPARMEFSQHPFVPPEMHPWNSPLAPPSFGGQPRPDWALQFVGGLAPSPDQFPFNDAGRADYYMAVQNQATMLMQQRQMAAAMTHGAAAEAEAAIVEENHRRAAFLLVL
jgi:hypothetical protein